jgi:uncharacterized protein (TIGR02453 family)
VSEGPFAGFGPDAVAWLYAIDGDNTKARFEATRGVWEAQIRAPMAALLEAAAGGSGRRVKLCRPHRDTRFSADKRPYKTNFWGVVMPAAGSEAGHYAELSTGGLFVGTGYYQMATDQLRRFRAAVADDAAGAELERLVAATEAQGVRVGGDAVATAPRGFARDHPRIALLRRRELIAGATLPPGPELESAAALDFCRRTWDAAGPLCAWLDRHVGPSEIPPEVRWGRG